MFIEQLIVIHLNLFIEIKAAKKDEIEEKKT